MPFQKGHHINKGISQTEDHKNKIGLANSISHKGLKQTKEHRRKIVESRHRAFLKRSGIKEEEWIYWPKYRDYKRGSKQRGIEFNLTMEQFKQFWQKPCYYCGDKIINIALDRIDNSKGYEINNIVSCCVICNYMKRNFPLEIFLEHCKKVVNYNNQLLK